MDDCHFGYITKLKTTALVSFNFFEKTCISVPVSHINKTRNPIVVSAPKENSYLDSEIRPGSNLVITNPNQN